MGLSEVWRGTDQNRYRLIAAVALLLAAVIILAVTNRRTGPPRGSIWYYDLNTRSLFAAPDRLSPIATRSGPHNGEAAGVRAFVYSCGTCDDESGRFPLFVEKLTPEALRSARAEGIDAYLGYGGPDGERLSDDDRMVKRPGDETWVVKSDPAAVDIMKEDPSRCSSGERLTACGDPLVYMGPR